MILSTFLCLVLGLLILSTTACPGAPYQPRHKVATKHARRWFSISQGQPWTTWPQGPNKISDVRYCYADASSRDILETYINRGWVLWTQHIGGNLATGHSFNWTEWKPRDPNGLRYCYKPVSGQSTVPDDAQRNPEIPYGVVVVRYAKGAFASTTGYEPETDDPKNNPQPFDLHSMILDPEYMDHLTHPFAHEIGHIMGLQHEFQRPDRDSRIKFLCENLKDYEDIKKELKDGDTMEKVCTDWWIADKYGAIAMWYVVPPSHWQGPKSANPDLRSIMMYMSSANIKPGNNKFVPGQCPVAQIIDGGLALLDENTVPSALDVAGVKQLYPPPKPHGGNVGNGLGSDGTVSVGSTSVFGFSSALSSSLEKSKTSPTSGEYALTSNATNVKAPTTSHEYRYKPTTTAQGR